jgi:predicted Zn-dependent peptidase
MFAVYAACGPDRADRLLAVVRGELLRAADSGFSEEEVARVKAQLKMGLLAGFESSGARAEQLARQILIHGRPLTTQALIEKVEAVTPADARAVVERLVASPVSLATVGPILHVARFDSLTAKFTLASSEAA